MSKRTRRRYLRGLGIVAVGGLAGCLNSGSIETDAANQQDDGARSGGESPTRRPATETHVPATPEPVPTNSTEESTAEGTTARSTPTGVGPSADPVRCRGESVTAKRTVEDEPGYEDNIRYFPSNSTVRVVTARNADGPLSYETVPFAEWVDWESGDAATEHVRTVIAERLGTDEFGSGYGEAPASADAEEVVWVSVPPADTEDGTVTPTVSLTALADAAPRSIDVTVTLEGDERTRTLPVYARHVVLRLP